MKDMKSSNNKYIVVDLNKIKKITIIQINLI